MRQRPEQQQNSSCLRLPASKCACPFRIDCKEGIWIGFEEQAAGGFKGDSLECSGILGGKERRMRLQGPSSPPLSLQSRASDIVKQCVRGASIGFRSTGGLTHNSLNPTHTPPHSDRHRLLAAGVRCCWLAAVGIIGL
jgi:hypothetical protein